MTSSEDETVVQFGALEVNDEQGASVMVPSASQIVPPAAAALTPAAPNSSASSAAPIAQPSEAQEAPSSSGTLTNGSGTPPTVADLPSQTAQHANTVPARQAEGNASNRSRSNNSVTDNNTSTNNSNSTTNSNSGNTNNSSPSFQQLGIITERPKRADLALRANRLATFNEWPRGHHLNVDDLTDAGFYFAGYGDCARCFFCGGGLRNWEINDNVWVEHARWFPRCAYMRYTRGQEFIDAIRRINNRGTDVNISLQDVAQEMYGTRNAELPVLTATEDRIESDAAVRAVVDMGFDKPDVVQAARELRSASETVVSDKIVSKLIGIGKKRGQPSEDVSFSVRSSRSGARDEETMSVMRQGIQELREQTKCKVCTVREVEVTFLPCGHCVCCMECSTALDVCAMCRGGIRGVVRTYFA